VHKGFPKRRHLPTLFAALLHFDPSLMTWVLLGPLGLAGAGNSSTALAVSGCPRNCAEAAIRHACVSNQLRSLTEPGNLLGTGTSCGSCTPELEKVLRDVRTPAS
jgi:bacterioferritin-associated ferredoxin